jgi:hypothetical protein
MSTMQSSDLWDPYTESIDITFDETAVWLEGAQEGHAVVTIGDPDSPFSGSFRGVLRRAGRMREVYWQPMMFELDADPEVWRPRKAHTIGVVLAMLSDDELRLYVERGPSFGAWLAFPEDGGEVLHMRYGGDVVGIHTTES